MFTLIACDECFSLPNNSHCTLVSFHKGMVVTGPPGSSAVAKSIIGGGGG